MSDSVTGLKVEFKPYYENKGIAIYNGDCLQIMKQFNDKSFDLVLTSPPYNMRTRIRNGQYTTREQTAHFSKKYSEFEDNSFLVHLIILIFPYLPLFLASF